jgi:hypothetical protein
MNKPALRIIVFLAFTLSCNSPVLAVKTNVNEVNDLFDRHIENKDQLMRDLKEQREGAVRDIETGKGLEHVDGINEAESKARELESIREVDLESSGRQKRASEEYRFYDDNELEPDYSKPGNIAHKRDADEIIAQTGVAMKKLGKDLQTKLSALGIDCHQVKGTTTKDLTYHIEISGEEHKNSEYEQVICEEPRNKYNCHDALTLRCTKKGMAWNPWQNRTMVTTFGATPRHWWTVGRHTDSTYHGRNGHGLTCGSWTINSAYVKEMATYIAGMIGVNLEQVYVGYQNIVLVPAPNRGSINVDFSNCHLTWLGRYIDIVPALVTFHYQYRDGYPICEQWSEDWSEACIIQ